MGRAYSTQTTHFPVRLADGSHIPHGFIHGSPYPMDLSMGGITPNPEKDILEKNQL
jgi:hypothetical protein